MTLEGNQLRKRRRLRNIQVVSSDLRAFPIICIFQMSNTETMIRDASRELTVAFVPGDVCKDRIVGTKQLASKTSDKMLRPVMA